MIDSNTLYEKFVTALALGFVTAGTLMITVETARAAHDALGLVGGGIILIVAGFALAALLRSVRPNRE